MKSTQIPFTEIKLCNLVHAWNYAKNVLCRYYHFLNFNLLQLIAQFLCAKELTIIFVHKILFGFFALCAQSANFLTKITLKISTWLQNKKKPNCSNDCWSPPRSANTRGYLVYLPKQDMTFFRASFSPLFSCTRYRKKTNFLGLIVKMGPFLSSRSLLGSSFRFWSRHCKTSGFSRRM